MSVAKLDSQLCFALYSASSRLTSIYRPILESLDLTYPQFIVLMSLWEKDNVSISFLAKKTQLSKATMTPLLKRLENKGFIIRQMLPENERQKNIVLTDDGRKLSLKSGDITHEAFCATGITENQAADMIEVCQQIVEQ